MFDSLITWFSEFFSHIWEWIHNALMGFWQTICDWAKGTIADSLFSLLNSIPPESLPTGTDKVIQYAGYVQCWFPLMEVMTILIAYFAWQFAFLVIRTIKKFIPTISG